MATTITIVVLGVLLLAAGMLAAWLAAERSHWRQRAQALGSQQDEWQTRAGDAERQLHAARSEAELKLQALQADADRRLQAAQAEAELKVQAQQADAERRLQAAQAEAETARQKLEQAQEQFRAAQGQARETFQALAGEVLKQTSDRFLQLASERMKVNQAEAAQQLEARRKAVDDLVKPIHESLEKYGKAMAEMEKARQQAYGSLGQTVRGLLEDQGRLRQETANLVKALRRPEVRGRWGEMQLRRVVELAGMSDHCDFTEQAVLRHEDGPLRPDLLIHLPAGRTVVIDAKAPLDAFLSATECEDDGQRDEFLDRHADQIESRVRNLSSKAYQDQLDRAADFVVLFIPGESFLSAALQRRPKLLESAMERKVILATPSTLIGLLKAIAAGWREEQLTQNAQKISEVGREMHERLRVAAGYVEALGSSLEKAVGAYNKFVASFDSRVMVTARKFEELGASSPKALPEELPAVNASPQALRSAGPSSPPAEA